ncbi:hypothetical protein [Bosea sp. 124]|uniref:hypothetical protein n=1 Tax=Bosea sp. 124 TaxID=2135642 RepID=UPI0011B28640|nr:hypothetical protein [Bosea sp. 124]
MARCGLCPSGWNFADASENSQRSNEISSYAALKFVHSAGDLMLSCVATATKSATWEDRMLLWTAIFWLGCAAIFLDMAERAPALD